MSHYNSTRQEVAEMLGMSLRSIDRYLKAGKIRSKKKGKIVYVHTEDVKNFAGGSVKKGHILVTKPLLNDELTKKSTSDTVIPLNKDIYKKDTHKITETFEKVYTDLRNQIVKKDEIIQKLSVEIGKNQEQVKHSISMSEYNRTQMLLEESREHMGDKLEELEKSNTVLRREVKDEKFNKAILMIFVFILVSIAAYFWFRSV